MKSRRVLGQAFEIGKIIVTDDGHIDYTHLRQGPRPWRADDSDSAGLCGTHPGAHKAQRQVAYLSLPPSRRPNPCARLLLQRLVDELSASSSPLARPWLNDRAAVSTALLPVSAETSAAAVFPVCAPNMSTTCWTGLEGERQSIGSTRYGVRALSHGPGNGVEAGRMHGPGRTR